MTEAQIAERLAREAPRRKCHDPEWLKDRGYDGLSWPEAECGCDVGDFAPCEEGPQRECRPAVELGGSFYPARIHKGEFIVAVRRAGDGRE